MVKVMARSLDILAKLRGHQQLMLRETSAETQEKFVDVMKTMYVEKTGSICPPWPDMVDPVIHYFHLYNVLLPYHQHNNVFV